MCDVIMIGAFEESMSDRGLLFHVKSILLDFWDAFRIATIKLNEVRRT